MNQPATSTWTIEDARVLYALDRWSNDYFGISPEGEITVSLGRSDHKGTAVPITQILDGIRERGMDMPVLLRFGELLESRIHCLHESFQTAIEAEGYNGSYHGVYPIKVNQQEEVVNQITTFGAPYHYGLEAGSKPELVAAVAYLNDPEAYLVCNGYKDAEFIDLALRAQKMGLQVILVVELPGEIDAIMERASLLGINPVLGIRARLAAESCGHWCDSAGHKSVFGLHMVQLMSVVDRLRSLGKLDCLRMLHFHQGSQIPNIRAIREAALEATRIYVDLVNEGATMGLIDLGGGLAVDYEGNQSQGGSGANYTLEEYCADMVHVIKRVTDKAGVPHPGIITESGRAVVAHSSVLIFDVVDVNRYFPDDALPPAPDKPTEIIQDFYDVWDALNEDNLQECYNDAVFYRDQLVQKHVQGKSTLRERALGENIFAHLMCRFSEILGNREHVPQEMKMIEELAVDFYYGNFSLFQSLPDSWGIEQIFPILPIHRLGEEPSRRAVLADITCDCDGRVDRFLGPEGITPSLPVHEWHPGDRYHIGAFLVGAYQETLGSLHNLIGDTNIVSVMLDEQGRLRYTNETEGDTVGQVLNYVEYDPNEVRNRFRRIAEQAVIDGRITALERKEFVEAYTEGLRGYTYVKH